MGYLANLLVKIGLDNSELNGGMDKATRSVNKFAGDVESAGKRLTVGLTLPLAGLGLAAIKTAGEMEQTKVAFTTLMKSADEAGKHIDDLKRFALSTPFQFGELTKASRLMQAYGFAAEDVVPKLRTIGNAVSALGGGSDLLERVVRSMGEIGTRGKITGEQLRELSRAGIPALDAIAKKLGVSVAQAQKEITAGNVDAKTAMDGLLEYMEGRFRGGMEAQSRTVLGSWSNIKDKITFTLADIGKALLPVAKNVMNGFFDPMLEKAKVLAEEFGKLPVPVQNTALALTGITAAAPLLMMAFGSMVTNGVAIAGVLPKIGKAAGALLGLFADLGSKTVGLAAGLSQTTDMFGRATGAMRGAGAAHVAMVATGILRVAGWIALADAVLKVANAHYELGRAEDAARDAGKTQEQKLEQTEKNLAMRAAGNKELLARLEELRKSYVTGAMGSPGSIEAWTKYMQGLQGVAKQLGTNISAEQKHAVSIVDIDKMLTDAGMATMAERKKNLEDAKALYAAVVKEYGAGSVIAIQALQKVNDAQAQLIPTLEKVKNHAQGLFAFGSKGVESGVIVETIRQKDAELQQYIRDVAKAGGLEKYNAQQAQSLGESFKLLGAPPVIHGFGNIAGGFQHIMDAALPINPEVQRINEALKNLTVNDAPSHLDMLRKDFDVLGAAMESGKISVDTYLRSWVRLVKEMDKGGEEIDPATKREVLKLEKQYGGQLGQTRRDTRELRRDTDEFFHSMSRGLTNAFKQWKGFGAGIASVFKAMGESLFDILFRRMMKPIEDWFGDVITELFSKTASQAAATKAATATLNVGTIASDAAVASAATFASISAIPVVGPAMAPAAAAAAYSQVMAMAPLAMFEKGGNVPEDMPAFLHKKEMVLPAELAEGMRRIIARGDDKSSGGTTFDFRGAHFGQDSMGQVVRQLRLAGARI